MLSVVNVFDSFQLEFIQLLLLFVDLPRDGRIQANRTELNRNRITNRSRKDSR